MTDPPDSPPIARMSDVDAVIWALESDPVLRANILVVALLDGSPGREALEAQLERGSRRLPRLRQRVVPSPIGIAPPRWELDPAFDIGYHLRVVGIPTATSGDVCTAGTLGSAGLIPLAEPLVTDGFDPSRPLWQLVLVEGLAGGKAGVVAKLHHALTDGVGAVGLAMSLLDLERHPRPAPLPPRPDEPLSTDVERVLDDIEFEVRRTFGFARRALPWAARGLRAALTSPEATVRQAMDFARSMATITAPGSRPLSPILTGRSPRTRLEVLAFSLEELRSAGKAAGGTVNDAFLAAVLGGLRLYHDKHGSRPEALRLGMALNRRSGEDPAALGNSFVPLRLLVPLQTPDPSERVAAIGSLVRRARSQPVLDFLGPASSFAGHLSHAATVTAVGASLRGTDVIASNVPGSPVPLYMAGARVERLVAFGPRSGAGLNLTLLSHEGKVEVGVNIDRAAAPDSDLLMACLREGFAEVTELA